MVAENGTMIAQCGRFNPQSQLLVADVDLDRIEADRIRTTSFADAGSSGMGVPPFRRIGFELAPKEPKELHRHVKAHPFVPRHDAELQNRCEEIFAIQTTALARRLTHIGKPPVTIGVSGGLDSTLALLVTCKTFDQLKEPRSKIRGYTLVGFGSTERTCNNSRALMKHLGVHATDIDIRPLCMAEFKALGHSPFGIKLDGLDVEGFSKKLRDLPANNRSDVVFENVQARAGPVC